MILTNDDPRKKNCDSGRRFGIFLVEGYELGCELRREIQDLRDTEGNKPSGIDLSCQCVQSHFQSSFSALELIGV